MWKLSQSFLHRIRSRWNFFGKVFVISSVNAPLNDPAGNSELILKVATYILAVLAVLFCSTALQAQSVNHGTHVVEAKLDLKGAEVQGSYLIISYEIPYSGMVEIRLFNEGGQKNLAKSVRRHLRQKQNRAQSLQIQPRRNLRLPTQLQTRRSQRKDRHSATRV